jgi:hypothetical protein
MTVSSTVSRVVHTANGSSVFFSSAPIQGLTAGNVVVTLTDTDGVTTTQVLGTDYTLSPSGVTFTTAPAAGTIVTIRRIVELLQPDQFETNSPFPAKIAENRLDQIVFGLQQAADDLGRTVRLHPSDVVSGTLPPAALRANRYLAFGPNGELTFPVPQPPGPNSAEAYWWGGTAGGTPNALTLSIGGAPGSYAPGQRYAFVVASNNTGAATLAVNGLGVKSLRRPDGSTLAANDLVAGNLVAVTYDGTNFRLAWSWTPPPSTAFTTDVSVSKTDPALILNKTASGQVARVFGCTNGSNRWAVELGDTTAEGGGNAGSNLVVRRYDNTGAVLGAPVVINRASGAVTLEAPLTLPASNPTDPNHATRKAYVDAGDLWVKLADAAVTNSSTIDVTGFSLQNYRMVQMLLLGAQLSSTQGSGNTTMQVYRGGTLVSTGYEWQRLTGSGTGAGGATITNDASVTLTFSGMTTAPVFMTINITQSSSGNNAVFYANVFYNSSSSTAINLVAGRATGGSNWTDGFRITPPVAFQNNIGRVIVLGLQP